jgi:transcriptional regulator with XRE-family HTH domain
MSVRIRIKELRLTRTNLTQEDFADFLGKSVDTISNYERGKTGVEVIQLIIKMCEILKCRVDELIDNDNKEELINDADPIVENKINNLDPYTSLRNWWFRTTQSERVLGEKEIENIINQLKAKSEFTSESDIPKIFSMNDELETNIRKIITEYGAKSSSIESNLLVEKNARSDQLSNSPDRLACIFAYLKTRDDKFLSKISSTLKRIVKKY